MMELVKVNEIKRKNQDKITKGYKSVHNDTTVTNKYYPKNLYIYIILYRFG